MIAPGMQEIQMLFIPLEVIPYFALFHSFSGGKVIMKTPC